MQLRRQDWRQDWGDGRLARPVAKMCLGSEGGVGGMSLGKSLERRTEKHLETRLETRTGEGARPPSACSPSAGHPSACQPSAGYRPGGEVGEEALDGHFFSKHADKAIHRRHLPHWGQDGVLCFVTFRLADSLPAGKLEEWHAEKEDWLRRHPRPWSESVATEYAERFPRRMERWLDAGHGECILRSEGARACMDGVFARSEGERCWLHAYVVMPNHVHVLCELRERRELSNLLHEWKSWLFHHYC